MTDFSQVTDKDLEAARDRARRKLADQLVEAEFGMSNDTLVKKGPPDRSREETYELTLDLPPHMDRLVIDGTIYLHGGTYKFPKTVYDSVRETIYRGFEHQREIEGKDRNAYRKQANVSISPGVVNTSAERILGRG